ncbi:MAG: hypothetical protein ACRDTT_09015 [Pseudonocardiaceae bacterium]
MESLPTIEGNPPVPRPIRLADRWRVAWHGRRDAKLRPVGADLPRPYLETLRADAEAGQRAVSVWLHQKIVPIDQEAVRLLAVLEQYRRDPVTRPTPTLTTSAPDDSDPRPAFMIPAWVVEARQAAEAQQAFLRRVKEQNIAEQQLGQLGSIRHHLIETARAAIGAHNARYEQLVGLYSAALLRHHPHRTLAEARRTPPAVTEEPWVHGDMPLLALAVDNELAESYRWFLKEFATRTSALEQPIPVDLPRAG